MGKKKREVAEDVGIEEAPEQGAKRPKKEKKKQKRVLEVDAVAAEQDAKAMKTRDGKEEAGGGAGADGEDPPEGGKMSRSKVSLVPKETATYLTEVMAHFKTLIDGEEKALLVGNVLEEIAGKEQTVAGDPVCSRHIETLLAAATPAQLLGFVQALMDTGGVSQLAVSPFGSHVVEKVLMALDKAHDWLSQAEYDKLKQVMSGVASEVAGNLWDYINDRFATHVARRVLCVLCGANVMPGGSKGPQAAAAAVADGEEGDEGVAIQHHKKTRGPAGGAVQGGLAAKLGTGGVGGKGGKGGKGGSSGGGAEGAAIGQQLVPGTCRFPAETEAVVRVLTSENYGGDSMAELTTGRYSSPFLQSALWAACTLPNAKVVLAALMPAVLGATYFHDGAPKAGRVLEGVSARRFNEMAEDPVASRVVEAAVGIAGNAVINGLVDEMVTRFLAPPPSAAAAGSAADTGVEGGQAVAAEPQQQGAVADEASGSRVVTMAQHATANYVLQVVLAATRTAAQVQPLYNQLGPLMGRLLRARRAGVVAALVAACGRASACQKELCADLATALTSLPQNAGKTSDAVLAPSLLTLDSAWGVSLGSNSALEPHETGLAGRAGGKGKGGGPQAARLSVLGGSILIALMGFSQGACRSFTDSVVGLGPADVARVGRDPTGSRVLEAVLAGGAPAKVKAKLLASVAASAGPIALSAPGSFLIEKAYALAEGEAKEALVAGVAAVERELGSGGCHWGQRLLGRLGVEAFKRDVGTWRQHVVSSAKAKAEFTELFGGDATAKGNKASKASNTQAGGDAGATGSGKSGVLKEQVQEEREVVAEQEGGQDVQLESTEAAEGKKGKKRKGKQGSAVEVEVPVESQEGKKGKKDKKKKLQ